MATIIHLEWPSNPAAENITKYEVLQSKDGSPFALIASPTTNSHDVPNPLPGVYRFKVRAVNFVGTGPESNIVEGPGIPTQVGDITLTVVTT